MYLDLGSNNISEINNFELMNLPFLRELRVQNNTLRRIHPMAFMNVPQLQYLYLQDNIISTLDGNRLQGFKNLEVLDVSNNALYAVSFSLIFPINSSIFSSRRLKISRI